MSRILKRNIDSFPQLRRDPKAIYIDKTAHIAQLVSVLQTEKMCCWRGRGVLARPCWYPRSRPCSKVSRVCLKIHG